MPHEAPPAEGQHRPSQATSAAAAEEAWADAVALYDEGLRMRLFSLHSLTTTTTTHGDDGSGHGGSFSDKGSADLHDDGSTAAAATRKASKAASPSTLLRLGSLSAPLAQVAVATFLERILLSTLASASAASNVTTFEPAFECGASPSPSPTSLSSAWGGDLVLELDDLDPIAVDERLHRCASSNQPSNVFPRSKSASVQLTRGGEQLRSGQWSCCPRSLEKAERVRSFLGACFSPPLHAYTAFAQQASHDRSQQARQERAAVKSSSANTAQSSVHLSTADAQREEENRLRRSQSARATGGGSGDGGGRGSTMASVRLVLSEEAVRSWLTETVHADTERQRLSGGIGRISK